MYDEDLTNLEEWLRRLKVEYHIFFNGQRSRPPDDLRMRVERLLKKLSESPNMTFSQRFRYTTLVTRFHVYRDLWRRTQLNHEMGVSNTGAPPHSPASSSSGSVTQEKVRISISDPKTEEDKVHALYLALTQMKGHGTKETHLSYPQFARYIETQTRGIREKYGCPNVAFTIALEDDAIRFTAVAENRQSVEGNR
jgi:hypothetical protein